MSGAGERRERGAWQAVFWSRAGKVHPTSVAVTELLDETVSDLLYWSSFDLDASADLDDLVQMLALAQLETQAARGPTTRPALRAEVQRRLRRAAWQVRQARGSHHRAEWKPAYLQHLAGPDGGLDTMEDLTWDDVVRTLGWRLGLAVWLTTVEGWTLDEIAEQQELTRQRAWRRVRQGLERLRAALAARR